MIGFGGVLREFGGVLGSLRGSRGGCLTPVGNLLPLQKSFTAPDLHTAPQPCQPDRLVTFSFLLDYFYCDQD